MGHAFGIKWTDELIETEIKRVMATLCIDRMPTRNETIIATKSTALNNAIIRSNGYKKWADKLELSLKQCDTWFGKLYEEQLENLLIMQGYKVKRMSTKHPYDLLVNEAIKIDVKVSKPFSTKDNSKYHTFNLEKKNHTCDVYCLFALDDYGNIQRVFVIPSFHVNEMSQLSLGINSKYNFYIDKWDYIEQYKNFYKDIRVS